MTTMPLWQGGIGLALALAGWVAARAVAGAWRLGPILATLQDISVPVGTFAVLTLATARPLFAGAASLAAYGGCAFTDHVKRQVLREPVVFTDMSELVELFRHPDLYLPFAGTGRVLTGAALALAAFIAAFVYEPPIFHPSWGLAALAIGGSLALITAQLVFVQHWAAMMRFHGASGDPFADSRRLGPFVTLGIYGAIARAERNMRRAAVAPPPASPLLPPQNRAPVILVQSESFFDLRRLSAKIPQDLLSEFARVRQEALQWGLLTVPCWGANTVRSEFAALSGLSETPLGFDRFNPYHAFARAPVQSLAWTLKTEGYETICIHPYDPTFYGRNQVMPALGFDRFIGKDAFSKEDYIAGYVGDVAVARLCAKLLRERREKPLFIFVVTMQNHGPWTPAKDAVAPLVLGMERDRDGLSCYMDGLKGADAMIASLCTELAADGRGGILGFYGDHLPSLPQAFRLLDFHDERSDYFVWRPQAPQGARLGRRDAAVHDLAGVILASLTGH